MWIVFFFFCKIIQDFLYRQLCTVIISISPLSSPYRIQWFILLWLRRNIHVIPRNFSKKIWLLLWTENQELHLTTERHFSASKQGMGVLSDFMSRGCTRCELFHFICNNSWSFLLDLNWKGPILNDTSLLIWIMKVLACVNRYSEWDLTQLGTKMF